jgi:hypothetical protein
MTSFAPLVGTVMVVDRSALHGRLELGQREYVLTITHQIFTGLEPLRDGGWWLPGEGDRLAHLQHSIQTERGIHHVAGGRALG